MDNEKKDSTYFKEKVFDTALSLASIKWWRPAIFARVVLVHYVNKYIEARENEVRDQEVELRAKMLNSLKDKKDGE